MNDDRAAVMLLVYALEDAWGCHDADAYGALFTSDATYTTFLGTRATSPTLRLTFFVHSVSGTASFVSSDGTSMSKNMP